MVRHAAHIEYTCELELDPADIGGKFVAGDGVLGHAGDVNKELLRSRRVKAHALKARRHLVDLNDAASINVEETEETPAALIDLVGRGRAAEREDGAREVAKFDGNTSQCARRWCVAPGRPLKTR